MFSPTGYVAEFSHEVQYVGHHRPVRVGKTLPVVKFNQQGVAMVCWTDGRLIALPALLAKLKAVQNFRVDPLDKE